MSEINNSIKHRKITLDDLPDLSDWAIAPILTLEQAALLWGGIDPAFCRFHEAHHEHEQKYRRAYITMQAFCGGVVLKTLQVHELFLIDRNYNGWQLSYKANQSKDEFSIEDIDCQKTTIQRMVLLAWAHKEKCLTLRQSLKSEEQIKKEIAVTQPEIITSIGYKPIEPIYDTPEFETACLVIKEFWNTFNGRGKPPKEVEIQEFIRKTLFEITGGKPSEAAVKRVDTLTRPPQFKNQQKTAK